MKLTICLVTKGRYLFLGDALRSYEPFLKTGFVNVVLVDNGADDKSKKLLMDWKNKYPDLVSYFRSDENEPAGTPFFWEKIKSFAPEWIIFPGDDDELVFTIFESFIAALKNKPEISVYGSSAQIIDIDGKTSGLIRQPAIHRLSSKAEQLSRSLHEPPFFWPGLFFKFDLIKKEVPNSRFVFDWWVGLQLILAGKILTTSDVGVRYRFHNLQESNQTPGRRKYLEGFHMLIEMINSEEFFSTLKSMSISEVIKLLELCFAEKLLYSQSEYNIPLMRELTYKAIILIESPELRNKVLEKYLFASGVLLKKSDLNNFYINSNLRFMKSQGNIEVNFANAICSELNDSLALFSQGANEKFTISCKHSAHPNGSIQVNCDEFASLSIAEIADAILVTINSHLEKNGHLVFLTTPFEKLVIARIRHVKSKMPKIILKNAALIKRLIGN